MTTTPDTQRRERYAAAEAAWRGINFWEMSAHGRGLFLEQNRGRIDAVMAVADQELTRVREELDEANRRHENFKMGATFGGTEMRKRLTEAEDALRTQAAEVRAAAYTECAELAEDINSQCGSAKPCASCVAREDLADDIRDKARRLAAAARPGQDGTPPVPDSPPADWPQLVHDYTTRLLNLAHHQAPATERTPATVHVPAATLASLAAIATHVSRGEHATGHETYPGTLARRALDELADAGLPMDDPNSTRGA